MLNPTPVMFIVGIAGGSGSGKSTFAEKVIRRATLAGAPGVVHLHQDSYYLPSPPIELRMNGKDNFDHPEAFDWPLLFDHLQRLKKGEQILAPIYDFTTSRRTSQTHALGPAKTIVFEGIYTLWEAEIRDLLDMKVYLHVDADIRFIRRLHRDVRERGRTLDSIIQQYYDTVRLMHHEYLEPTRQFADLIVGEETDVAADVVAARVKEMAFA